jgi:hypothetical protein
MAKPNALVDGISSLSPSAELLAARADQSLPQFVEVSFKGGRTGRLDTSIPHSAVWAEVIDSMREAKGTVYVEIDQETNLITELLCPLTVTIADIVDTATKEAVVVELTISQARHYLKRTNPEFQQLLNALQDAKEKGTEVLVTETIDTHEIIDVRPNPNPLARAEMMVQEALEVAPQLAPVTLQKAQELFNLMNSKICCPASGAPPCIPFLYPDDGCWARAHEMCRLIIAAGVQPDKVWIYAKSALRAATRNHPSCQVVWGWHVAPTLLVNTTSGPKIYVIDPSLFDGPVPQATWVNVQGDPYATTVPTNASVYHRFYGGSVSYDDANYTRTKQDLANYRNQLKLRSVGPNGPPPYIQCLPKPSGVQWFGTIAPKATHSWYTWGWPASWHIIWTIMPITPCPGGAQLSWTVQVERANATQCTYWIAIKNLTSDPVRFEGRYDILAK